MASTTKSVKWEGSSGRYVEFLVDTVVHQQELNGGYLQISPVVSGPTLQVGRQFGGGEPSIASSAAYIGFLTTGGGALPVKAYSISLSGVFSDAAPTGGLFSAGSINIGPTSASNTNGTRTLTGGTTNINSGTESIVYGVSNNVTGNYCAVFGRLNQLVSATVDSFAIGQSNLISGSAGIQIGVGNTMYTAANAWHFGNGNYTQSGNHTVLIGRANVSLYGGDNYAFGYSNGIADAGSFGIGGTNAANGQYNMCLGHSNASGGGSGNTRLYILGKSNTLHGTDNIAIGYEIGNDVTTDLGVHQIGLGYRAYMRQYGEVVHAAGRFSANGDAQTSQLVARKVTTDDTPTEIALDGATTYLSTEDNTAYAFVVMITAKKSGALDHAMYRLEWSTVRGTGVGSVTVDGLVKTTIFETNAAWDVTVTADLTNGRPAIKLVGVAATTINWVAKIEITEVTV